MSSNPMYKLQRTSQSTSSGSEILNKEIQKTFFSEDETENKQVQYYETNDSTQKSKMNQNRMNDKSSEQKQTQANNSTENSSIQSKVILKEEVQSEKHITEVNKYEQKDQTNNGSQRTYNANDQSCENSPFLRPDQIPANNINQKVEYEKRQQTQCIQQNNNYQQQEYQQSSQSIQPPIQRQQFNLQSNLKNPDLEWREFTNYSTRYQIHHPAEQDQKNNNYNKFTKKSQLTILYLNCKFGKHRNMSGRTKQQYSHKNKIRKARELVKMILQAMDNYVDIISVHQMYDKIIRIQLLYAIKQRNQAIQNKFVEFPSRSQYNYPDNLYQAQYDPKSLNCNTTMILTYHPIKLGLLGFQISSNTKSEWIEANLPLQAFCQFDIKICEKEQYRRVCILSCDLIPNECNLQQSIRRQIQRKQIQCIKDFRQNYDIFLIQGKINIQLFQGCKIQKEKPDTRDHGAYWMKNGNYKSIQVSRDEKFKNCTMLETTISFIE